MGSKTKYTAVVGMLIGIAQWAPGISHGVEATHAAGELSGSGVQSRTGKVIKIQVAAGETRFQIDSCPQNLPAPGFFVIAANNPDKLDLTRMLVAAMVFTKEVKVYNAAYGDDVDYCPRTGLAPSNVTVGTVRIND